MKKISAGKVVLWICAACFAIIAAMIAHALEIPGKIIEKFRD